MNDKHLTEDAIFKIGTVVSVDGRVVRVRVDKTKNSSHLVYRGELLKNISVGGYIKVIKGFTVIIGKVEGEFVSEDKQSNKKEYGSERDRISRTLSVSLLGFFNGNKFERGIKELPLIDNECFLLQRAEFEQVHNFIRPDDVALTIGALALEKGQPIRVGVNGLFASHIGIFGNTGSGKSYTLAKLYRELFDIYKDKPRFKKHAKFFLIDFNGEYIDHGGDCDDIIVEQKYKDCYRLSTSTPKGDKFPISRQALSDSEFWVVFLEATEKTQMPFLRRSVDNPFLEARLKDEVVLKRHLSDLVLSAVTEGDRSLEKAIVMNLLLELKRCFDDNHSIRTLHEELAETLKFHSKQNKFYLEIPEHGTLYSDNPEFRTTLEQKISSLQIPLQGLQLIDEIRVKIVLQYYDEIIRGFSNKEHLAPLIKRMDKRIDDLKKVIRVEAVQDNANVNLTIVSLKDVNLVMRKVLPLLFAKKLYADKRVRAKDGGYLNIIIDEAHNVLFDASERESEQWKDYRLETFEEIIKEGRKFGVFLTVASQRPSDISPTIISQLHNYFLHRLINNEDIRAVEKTISYLDKVSFEYLPILPTGTCIMAGLLANVPVVVDIGKIEPAIHEPKNKTVTLTDNWV